MGVQTRSKMRQHKSKRSDDSEQGLLSSPTKAEKSGFRDDFGSIALLVLLYLLQGVPLGLSMGSIPFLLKSKLNFGDLALFSLSAYPYSLKLLWSPIVDTIFFKAIGRRKSWILPMQFILGFCLFIVGGQIDSMLDQDNIPVMYLAIIFTGLVFLCATQDIAVDGWALELLTEENKTYASTAQTIGLNTGYFLSFTVFLAFNSHEFCNKYIRSIPSEAGLLSLGTYLQFWGVAFVVCNAFLVAFTSEKPAQLHSEEIMEVYKTIWDVSAMPHMQTFIIVQMICKIGFIANEAVTGLKLLELGFNKEYLAMAVLIDFPFQLIFGYYAAKWSNSKNPLTPVFFK